MPLLLDVGVKIGDNVFQPNLSRIITAQVADEQYVAWLFVACDISLAGLLHILRREGFTLHRLHHGSDSLAHHRIARAENDAIGHIGVS